MMQDQDPTKTFDAIMMVLDEAIDASSDEELLSEERDCLGSEREGSHYELFLRVASRVARNHQRGKLEAAVAQRRQRLAALEQPSRIPSDERQQRELFRQVVDEHPGLSMAARNEVGPPSAADVASALRKFEALGILFKFLEVEDES